MYQGENSPASTHDNRDSWRDYSDDPMQDLPLDELQGIFDLEDLRALDAYQRQGNEDSSKEHGEHTQTEARQPEPLIDRVAVQRIIERPFSDDFMQRYEARTLGKVACNIAIYDDETEDAIDNDHIIIGLRNVSRQGFHSDASISPEDNVRAMRIRRTIVALLYAYQADVAVEPVPVHLSQSPDDTTPTAA